MKSVMLNGVILLVSTLFILGTTEGLLHLKNSNMQNYDIEMWRYSKEIKTISKNTVLGHEHQLSKQALLQSVLIRTNNFGLRGDDINVTTNKKRRILALGSSITLGWGVEKEETMFALLDKKLGEDVEVLNAGIGNYNTQRYVELFFTKLKELNPTDIIVNYALNDVEILHKSEGNWFLQNSQLAVTLWSLFKQLSFKDFSIQEYYKNLYKNDAEGYSVMLKALDRLSAYAKEKNIRLYFILTPEMHKIANYPFEDLHKQVKEQAEVRDFKYLDLYETLKDIKDSKEYWVMPTDPHPNAKAHKRFAEAVYPFLVLHK